jgi:beta-glucanase (GH16 family)
MPVSTATCLQLEYKFFMQNAGIRILSLCALVIVISIIIISVATCCFSQNPATPPTRDGWTLVWSDEFNGPNGSSVDGTKWVAETGGKGWGNHELEYYTDRSKNASMQDGNLVIRALQDNYTGPDGIKRNYTSVRLKTLGTFSQAYGRFEARIKIPYGQGIWPGFWMLGDDFEKVGWPQCGEIDIMENIGKEPATIHGSIHGPGYIGTAGIEADYTLPGPLSGPLSARRRFADDFHIFGIEWDSESISFYVDNDVYARRTRADLQPGWKWVFDKPFFLILDLAVGGDWPGNPDSTTVFPQSMLVDYVRVYQRSEPAKKESAKP